MSWLYGCAPAHNLAEFGQNLEKCTPKVKKSFMFYHLKLFCCIFVHSLCEFSDLFLRIFLRKFLKGKF